MRNKEVEMEAGLTPVKVDEFSEGQIGPIDEEFELQTKIKIEALILKTGHLINRRLYSAESLWRYFFDYSSKELGSMSKVIKLLTALKFEDERIFGLLKLSGCPAKKIIEIFDEAGWDDVRIGFAVARFYAYEYDSLNADGIKIVLATFLLDSKINDGRLIRILHLLDCFSFRIVNILIKRKWSELRFFAAIVDSGCFDLKMYRIMVSSASDNSESPWNDARFMALMTELKMNDAQKVDCFNGAGKLLSEIYGLCLADNWTEDRLMAAYIEAGNSPGKIAVAYIGYVKAFVSAQESHIKQLRIEIKKVQDLINSKRAKKELSIEEQKDLTAKIDALNKEIKSIDDSIVKLINDSKVKAVTMLEKMMPDDLAVYIELYRQDWNNAEIVDYLVVAGWTPERVINVLKEFGWTEYYVMRAIRDLMEDYEFGGNEYWDAGHVKIWKKVVRQVYPKHDIATELAKLR